MEKYTKKKWFITTVERLAWIYFRRRKLIPNIKILSIFPKKYAVSERIVVGGLLKWIPFLNMQKKKNEKEKKSGGSEKVKCRI